MPTTQTPPVQQLPIGQLLLTAGLVSKDHLDKALSSQLATGQKLGATLINQGVLETKDLAAALMVQESVRNILEAQALVQQRVEEILETLAPPPVALDSSQTQCLRVGELLIARSEVRRADVEEALRRQAGTDHRIGAVLVAMGVITATQLARVLLLQRSLMLALLALGVGVGTALAPINVAAAPVGGSTMQVSVTIQKHAKINVTSNPVSMQVTQADIARGYVDLAERSSIDIQSNSKDSIVLEFQGRDASSIIREVQVREGGRMTSLSSSGARMLLAGAAQPGVVRTVELSYRVFLAADVQPGTYAWPITLTAMLV